MKLNTENITNKKFLSELKNELNGMMNYGDFNPFSFSVNRLEDSFQQKRQLATEKNIK